LVRLASAQLRRRPPLILPPLLYRRLVHPILMRRGDARRRRALERMEAFFPYFTMRVRFDDRRARARLEPQGIAAPPLERYFDRLVAFARRARWGRAAPTRAEVHGRRQPAGRGGPARGPDGRQADARTRTGDPV